MTRSGSGSSVSDKIHAGVLCLVMAILECHIFEGPETHGSRRIVNAGFVCPGVGGKEFGIGSKVRRKEASELICLTVKDIFGIQNDILIESCSFV
jgi:hypothetical protein